MLELLAVHHIGIRVVDGQRAADFYAKLGFELIWQGGPEPVMVLRNANGVEINLIVNGQEPDQRKNVLMDVPVKHPGYTHVALQVRSIDQAVRELAALSIPLSDGPMQLGDGTSLFLRDPDGNVIELRESQAIGT